MSRGEERVESVPLMMKMMHLMVHRRQVPKKKTSSSVKETLNDGLGTSALGREESDVYEAQQILKHPTRQAFKYPEPGGLPSLRNAGEEAVGCAGFEQALREAADSANGNGDDRSSSGKGRHRRSTCLDRKQLHRIRLGPTLTTSLSLNETRHNARICEKRTADECAGKFAYISLDGRLINAELATSARSIGGILGDAEARAWEDFVPMQRVLVVAVSAAAAAAAAAAAKQRKRGDIDSLLKTVDKRIVPSRQQRILSAIASLCNIILSSLHTFFCTLVTTMGITSLWSLQRWSGMLTGRRKLSPSMRSQENGFFSLRQELSELCEQSKTDVNDCEPIQIPEPLAVRGSPKTPSQEQPPVLRGRFDGDNVKVNLNLQEAWSSANLRVVSELRDEGEFDESQLSRDSPVNKDVVFVERPPCQSDLFNTSAFQVGDKTRTKGEAKWYVNPMVETSEDFYFTPERCNPAVHGSSEWEVLRSSFGSRETYPSTGLSPLVYSALGTPAQMTVSDSSYQTVMDDPAVHQEHVAMRAWCAAIILDLRKQMLSVLDKEAAMAIVALDSSVRDAKSQLESMHLTVASCWNASMPKVLAALQLSPFELDSWLLNDAQGAGTWSETPKIGESIVAWRQYLEKNDMPSEGAERKCPNKFSPSECTVSLSGGDEWLGSSAYPRYSRQSERSIGVRSGGLVCPRVPSEDSADQRLGASDKAIASEAKGCEDVATLVTQFQSKEVEVADLEEGQQTLAMLVEISGKKDSTLSNVKQDIQALESKVQKARVYQSPVVQRGLRYSTPSKSSPSSGNGILQKQRFSDRHAPSAPASDPVLEHIGRFKEAPSNRVDVRNLPCTNTQRHEELTDDGRSERGYDQENSRDYSHPPESTIGDDCSVSSRAFPETEVESHFGSENHSSGDDSRYRSSKDRLSGAKFSSDNRMLQKQKSASSDLWRSAPSPASGGRGLTRTQSNTKKFTSSTPGSKSATRENYPAKPSLRTYSSEIKKVIKDPNSPQTCNMKGVRSVAANHCRSSLLDINICATLETSGLSVGMPDGRALSSQEKSVTKRKRWV